MEQLILSEQAVGFLKEAKKWTYFLAILGFIGAGFILLAGIVMSIVFSTMDVFANMTDTPDFPYGLLGIMYILLAVVYFFPAYYLYKFSTEMGQALVMWDDVHLTSSFRFLKKHFKFIGILIISLIAFYFLLILVLMIVGVTSFMSPGAAPTSFT